MSVLVLSLWDCMQDVLCSYCDESVKVHALHQMWSELQHTQTCSEAKSPENVQLFITHHHEDLSDLSPIFQTEPVTGNTNRDVGCGFGRLWFTGPDCCAKTQAQSPSLPWMTGKSYVTSHNSIAVSFRWSLESHHWFLFIFGLWGAVAALSLNISVICSQTFSAIFFPRFIQGVLSIHFQFFKLFSAHLIDVGDHAFSFCVVLGGFLIWWVAFLLCHLVRQFLHQSYVNSIQIYITRTDMMISLSHNNKEEAHIWDTWDRS